MYNCCKTRFEVIRFRLMIIQVLRKEKWLNRKENFIVLGVRTTTPLIVKLPTLPHVVNITEKENEEVYFHIFAS